MSNSIGDRLPYKLRKEIADTNFKIGSVFKFYEKGAHKEKRLIFIGEKYNKVIIAFLYINSEINENVFHTNKLKNEHLRLEYDKEHRPFLDHTSYVDCSQFIEKEKKEIYNLIAEKPSTHLGFLSESDLLNIKHKIATSKVLTASQKKNFGLFFDPLKK